MKEMKNCFDKLMSPYSETSTQVNSPEERKSRFDRNDSSGEKSDPGKVIYHIGNSNISGF